MVPFDFNPSDTISLHEAATKIAKFVGMEHFKFFISRTPHKKNVGGHIDLHSNTGNDVFIEISDDLVKFPSSVLAILAHEISHKLLSFYDIKIANGSSNPISERENEILTDITAVYNGLGKLMLNGCETEKIKHGYLIHGNHYTIETTKTGYLTLEQLAFVYLLVCSMRKIDEKECFDDIIHIANQALHSCRDSYSMFFDKVYHSPEYKKRAKSDCQNLLFSLQKSLAQIDRNLISINCSLLNTTNNFLNKSHKIIQSCDSNIHDKCFRDDYNPSLNYLDSIYCKNTKEKIKTEIKDLINESNDFLTKLISLNKTIEEFGKPFLDPATHTINPIICRICGEAFKVPENKGMIKAKCTNSSCNYEVLIDTDPLHPMETKGIESSFFKFFKK